MISRPKPIAGALLGIILGTVLIAGGLHAQQAANPAVARGWGDNTGMEMRVSSFNALRAAAAKSQDFRAFLAYTEQEVRTYHDTLAFNHRGVAHSEMKQSAAAVADFSRALELARQTNDRHMEAVALFNRSGFAGERRDWTTELRDLHESSKLDPNYTLPLNALAWLRATCPEPGERDGVQAVALARRAWDMDQHKDSNFLDTLAAAYAEAGKFDEAVAQQKKAIQLSRQTAERDDPAYQKDLAAHLALYQTRQPVRDDLRQYH